MLQLPKLNDKNFLRHTVWEYEILMGADMMNSEVKRIQ